MSSVTTTTLSDNWHKDPRHYKRDEASSKPKHIPTRTITCDHHHVADELKDLINDQHVPLAVGVVMSGSRVDLTLTTSNPEDKHPNRTVNFNPKQTCIGIDTEKEKNVSAPTDDKSYKLRENYLVLQQILQLIVENTEKLGKSISELPITFTVSGWQLPDDKKMAGRSDITQFGMPEDQSGYLCVPNPRPGNLDGHHPAIFNVKEFLRTAARGSDMGITLKMENDKEAIVVKKHSTDFADVKVRFEIVNDGVLCARAIAAQNDFSQIEGVGENNEGLNVFHSVFGTGTNAAICEGYKPGTNSSQGSFTEKEINTEFGHYKLGIDDPSEAWSENNYWDLDKFRDPSYNNKGPVPYSHENIFGGGNATDPGENRIRGLKGQLKYIHELVQANNDSELEKIVNVFKHVDGEYFADLSIDDLKSSKLLNAIPDKAALAEEDQRTEEDQSSKPAREKEKALLKVINDAAADSSDKLAEALVTTYARRMAEFWIAKYPKELKNAHVISLNGSNGCGILSRVPLAKKAFEKALEGHVRKDVQFVLFAGEHDMDGHCEYEREQAITNLRGSKDLRSKLRQLAMTADAKAAS